MSVYLDGSSGTGQKIIENWALFTFTDNEIETRGNELLYKYDWSLEGQEGYISIIYDKKSEKISNSSLIDTINDSKNEFKRPLGLYNDPSLLNVFKEILKSKGQIVKGVFAER